MLINFVFFHQIFDELRQRSEEFGKNGKFFVKIFQQKRDVISQKIEEIEKK